MAVASPRASAQDVSQFVPLVFDTERGLEENFWVLANAIRQLQEGKILATGSVTLTANQATSTLTDIRIGPNSVILFMATTANAAAEVGAGGMYVSARTGGSATITHANNAQADRTFAYAVLG